MISIFNLKLLRVVQYDSIYIKTYCLVPKLKLLCWEWNRIFCSWMCSLYSFGHHILDLMINLWLLKWFLIPQNMGLDTKFVSLALSRVKLEIHSLKWSLTSYSPFSPFWTSRSIWGFWQWSQMIYHTQKPGVRHQNQVSSMSRSKVTDFTILSILRQIFHFRAHIEVQFLLVKNAPNLLKI